jgi:O-antigen ligase
MYLDVLMKTGCVGLLLFLLTFFGASAKHLLWELRHRREHPAWDSPQMRNRFLTAAFLGVALTSWFNPFLNNPMGISLLMLTSTAICMTNKN